MIAIIAAMNATVKVNAAYGPGTGPIFLDRVNCTGQEDRLLNCPSSLPEINSCNHNQDASVECGGKMHKAHGGGRVNKIPVILT